MNLPLTTKNIKASILAMLLGIAMIDSVPEEFWPVWARGGNSNIFSKIIINGEGMV